MPRPPLQAVQAGRLFPGKTPEWRSGQPLQTQTSPPGFSRQNAPSAPSEQKQVQQPALTNSAERSQAGEARTNPRTN